MRPSEVSCGPSTANGLPCSPRARAPVDCGSSRQERFSRASAIAASGFLLENAFCQREQPGQRDANPGRSICGLVGNLGSGVFDQEEVKQRTFISTDAGAARHPIVVEEGTRGAGAKLGNKSIALRLISRRGTDACAVNQRGACIVDGAKEPSHVAQRTGLGTALGDRG